MFCNYHERMTFECIDGYLHDRDYDYVDPENVDYPCPNCNREEYFINEKRHIEGTIDEFGFNSWELLISQYCERFNVEVKELYKMLSENEELKLITIHREDENGAVNEITYNYEEIIKVEI